MRFFYVFTLVFFFSCQSEDATSKKDSDSFGYYNIQNPDINTNVIDNLKKEKKFKISKNELFRRIAWDKRKIADTIITKRNAIFKAYSWYNDDLQYYAYSDNNDDVICVFEFVLEDKTVFYLNQNPNKIELFKDLNTHTEFIHNRINEKFPEDLMIR